MAHFLPLTTLVDPRGSLTVIDKVLPYEIKRIYYIYNVTQKRGGHRHKVTTQGLICVKGSCTVFVDDGHTQTTFVLDSPEKCLIVEPKDWHEMDNFSSDAVLMVIASHSYDVNDYIDKPYAH